MVMKKYDLQSEIIHGYSFRKVRDLLTRMGQHGHPDAYFYAEMAHHLAPEIIGKPLTRQQIGRAENRDGPSYKKLLEVAKTTFSKLIDALIKEQLLDRRSNCLYRTDDSISLRAQKSLKRIPRERGLELLQKATKVASDFNAEAGPAFYITQLRLFGSLAREDESGDIGDVDLSVVVVRRNKNNEAHFKADRERAEKICPSKLSTFLGGLGFATQNEGISRIQKLSPYISFSPDDIISNLLTSGEPTKIIYSFEPPK